MLACFRKSPEYFWEIFSLKNCFFQLFYYPTVTILLTYYTMDFKQAQELMKLQQQAQKIQEELSNTHIEAEVDGVVVTIDGQLKVVTTVIEDKSILADQSRLEKAFTEAVNKGMKKAQEIAADRMRGVMGQMGLNLPGM